MKEFVAKKVSISLLCGDESECDGGNISVTGDAYW